MVIKKIGYFVFIIVSIFVINELIHSIYNLWQKNSLIDQEKQVLSVEKKRHNELLGKLKIVGQPQFVEEEARNKLFLVKPGEGIVVVAPTMYLKTSTPAAKKIDTRPHWRQWWETFF